MLDDTRVSTGSVIESDQAISDFSALSHIARGMHVTSGGIEETLNAIVRSAITALPGADDAGLIVVVKDALEPVAATGPRPKVLDELQRKIKRGPCFEAATGQQPVLVAQLQNDPRWDELHGAAVELGVASLACVPLRVGTRMTGALTLYSGTPDAFANVDLAFLELFATLAALSLAEAQQAEQLRNALASRDLLGQAKGILMERLRVGSDEAFAMLSAASQTTNVKVTAVADHLVTTGELLAPGLRAR